jgi:hypothetical protein
LHDGEMEDKTRHHTKIKQHASPTLPNVTDQRDRTGASRSGRKIIFWAWDPLCGCRQY